MRFANREPHATSKASQGSPTRLGCRPASPTSMRFGIVPNQWFESSVLYPAARRSQFVLLVVGLILFGIKPSLAQTGVAARVGNESVSISRLQPQVELVLTRTSATGRRLDIIKAQILEENIKQRLVNQYLQESRFKATKTEVDLELSDLKKDLTARKKTLADLFKEKGITEEQLRQSLSWDISWGKYLDSFLTDENLTKYFNQHRRKMDGTELHVAHVLIKPEDENSAESWKKAFEKSKTIHEQILKKKISFEAAVIEHSSGATKINKGDLGWIGWRGPMAAEFTRAAFELKKDEVSPPVQTTFGFHLIKLIAIKPGKAQIDQVKPVLLQSVKRYLFDWLAEKQAAKTKIEFTGEFPYFEFGTKKLGKF